MITSLLPSLYETLITMYSHSDIVLCILCAALLEQGTQYTLQKRWRRIPGYITYVPCSVKQAGGDSDPEFAE